jgi:ParB/RepB/Spo0J family partition protein
MIQAVEVEVNRLFLGKSNVRHEVGDITELVASIREKGILHPIVVRPVGKRFEVIVGSRRFTAAKKLRLKKIPAIVRPLGDTEALVESLIENVQRGDLDFMDEGEAYEVLIQKVGGFREVERQTGIGHVRVTETLEALSASRKLQRAGIKVTGRLPTTSVDRTSKNALPKQHAIELERAFKSEGVRGLPEQEQEKKYVELARAIAPLPQVEARKVLNEFKMYPERNVDEIEAKASNRLSGVALETYLPARIAKELDQIAQEKKTSIEEVLPDILQRGLSTIGSAIESKQKIEDATVVTEVDTGYVFSCPVCKGKYRILHNKPTDVHRFEELD